MSHFTRVRTALREPDLLAAALTAVGFAEVEVHDTPQTLYGYLGDARPERAEVIIRRADRDGRGLMTVTVSDDGRGGADPAAGHGLRGIADRVEAIGGALRVDAAPDGGTRVYAEVPCG